jgi:hypothetical protein
MKKWHEYIKFSSTKSHYFITQYTLLWFITIVSLLRSLLHIFLADGGASTIATIPLDLYSDAAQKTIVSMFAFWGLAQFMMALVMVYILVAKKEKSMVLYGVLFVEYAGRLLIGWVKPFETIQTAPGAIGNYVFLVLAIVSLMFHVIFIHLNKRLT